jgi:hypothetical protein
MLADVVDAIWKSATFEVVRRVSNCAKGYCCSCSLSALHICNLRASRHNLLSYPQNGDNKDFNASLLVLVRHVIAQFVLIPREKVKESKLA